mmetsp:Transcript_10269/g.12262  ORF Transcript_10269/g.12262 Transcript_10269/m.12262 type:complete len:160 (-) Transcript_10269:252-731(-)|eukprot:jgi/Bigna1/92046/estExt_fgenesh1_pg.C_2240001
MGSSKKNAVTKVASASVSDAKRRIERKRLFDYNEVGFGCLSHDSAMYDLGEYIKDDYSSTFCCCCTSKNTELIRSDAVVTIAFNKGNLLLNCLKFGCCSACCAACCPAACSLPMIVEWKLEGGFTAYSIISEHDAERFELYFYEKYKEKLRTAKKIAMA